MEFINANNIFQFHDTYNILEELGQNYPDFHNWYWNKVVPGVLLDKDEIILAYRKKSLVGVSIIKDSYEQKIRALRISPAFQNKGYGLYLIDESIKRLNNDKPLASVSEDMINDFSRVFINRYNFDITHVHKGLYIPKKLEYQFNGKEKSLKETFTTF